MQHAGDSPANKLSRTDNFSPNFKIDKLTQLKEMMHLTCDRPIFLPFFWPKIVFGLAAPICEKGDQTNYTTRKSSRNWSL